jgi:hypothetical protein
MTRFLPNMFTELAESKWLDRSDIQSLNGIYLTVRRKLPQVNRALLLWMFYKS